MTEDDEAKTLELARLINSIPALYANRIYSTMLPLGMRLTFCELNPSAPEGVARAGVLLSYEDVEQLIELLQRQMSLVSKVNIGEASAQKS